MIFFLNSAVELITVALYIPELTLYSRFN